MNRAPLLHTEELGLLATARRGITYSAAMLVERDDGILYINMKSFKKGGGFNWEGVKYYKGPYSQEDLVQEQDLLIVNTDVTPGGDIVGIPVVLPEEFRGAPILFSHHVTRLRLDDCIDPEYLFYLLCTDAYRRKMLGYARGTTVLMLDMPGIRRIPITYPKGRAEQKRIVGILRTIDQAIESTEALIEKYQQIKSGLMHDLFTRGIGTDGKLRPPRQQAPELYQQTSLGWLPKKWALSSVERLGALVTSGSRDWARYYSEEGDIFVRIGNLTREHINFRFDKVQHVTPPKNTDGQRTRLLCGDILVSITADLGIIGVVPEHLGNAFINQHIAMVRFPAKTVNIRYLGHYFSSAPFQKYVAKLNDSGAKAGLNLPAVRGFPVPVPEQREQEMLAGALDAADNLVQREKEHLEKLRSKKAGLMHDLLTGERPMKVTNQPANAAAHV